MISLTDILRLGGDLLVPREPVSPYRYIQRLIHRIVARKYSLRHVLEIGPGTDSIFRYLDPDSFESATIIDYEAYVLESTLQAFAHKSMHAIKLDVEEPGALERLETKWDFVVASSLIEHLKNDFLFVERLHRIMTDGGYAVCTTVLGPRLYNLWDHAVGHYRRYTVSGLRQLFSQFSEVQIIQTSVLQELARPLFFRRIQHLGDSTIEENNRRFSAEHSQLGRPPYARLFWLLRWILPLYLMGDWALKDLQGGIAIVIARK